MKQSWEWPFIKFALLLLISREAEFKVHKTFETQNVAFSFAAHAWITAQN